MTCAGCSRKLRYSGRGRPPDPLYEVKHRREYLRDAKRRERSG